MTGATLSGAITDPSGAAIPQAQVLIRNSSTGLSTVATTNTDEFYSAPNLLPGAYTVTVTAAGFATVVQTNVTLAVGEKQALQVAMKVGQSAQKRWR